MTDLPLASEFPPATREQWRKLVDGVLKGASFEKTLVSKTYDGLKIDPLYGRRADASALAGRAAAAPWQVMMRVDNPDPKAANTQALEDLENGANGLVLVCPGSIGAQGFGIDTSADGLARILDGIYLDAGAPIEFQLTREAKDVPAHVAAIIKQRGLDPAACDLRIGFDPIGLMAAGSSAPAPWGDIAPLFAAMTRTLSDEGFRGPFATADARVIHNAGGSEVQELAYALSVAVAYWRALEAGGVSLDDARRMIFFRLSADADQFMTMAKFRSVRKLWARVEEASGLAPQPAFIAAETAWRMMTQRDPYVNMLRVTIATFAAGLGGANAVTVLPFTSALGLPDAFARRVARNTQLILLEESNLAKVSDPAAGSGGIEELTEQLCRAAWALFQDIEKAGGAAEALASGLIQNKIAETRRAREKAVATRKDPLTGTSEFPHLSENSVKVLIPAPHLSSPHPERGRSAGEARRVGVNGERDDPSPSLRADPPLSGEGSQRFNSLPCIRLAEPFEKLRDTSDAMLKTTGQRPKVFLAMLGMPADFVARATFARNFFEAGGIETVEFSPPPPLSLSSPLPSGERSTPKASGEGEQHSIARNPSSAPSPSAPDRPLPMGEVTNEFAALASAFKSSGAALACLCSSDEVYASQSTDAAQALSEAGAEHIYLAGRPGDLGDTFGKAGIRDFIHAGCDAVATLTAAYDIVSDKSL